MKNNLSKLALLTVSLFTASVYAAEATTTAVPASTTQAYTVEMAAAGLARAAQTAKDCGVKCGVDTSKQIVRESNGDFVTVTFTTGLDIVKIVRGDISVFDVFDPALTFKYEQLGFLPTVGGIKPTKPLSFGFKLDFISLAMTALQSRFPWLSDLKNSTLTTLAGLPLFVWYNNYDGMKELVGNCPQLTQAQNDSIRTFLSVAAAYSVAWSLRNFKTSKAAKGLGALNLMLLAYSAQQKLANAAAEAEHTNGGVVIA